MGKFRINHLFIIMACLAVASCSVTRTLPPDEKLYTGADVTLQASDITSRQQKVYRSDLEGLTRPKPNSRFLGIPLKLMIYNFFGNKPSYSLLGKLRDRFGEPPVLLSTVDVERNIQVLQSHLENKGFFKAKVTGDTVVKGRKGSAEYKAEAGSQYKVASIAFDNDSSILAQKIREASATSLIEVGSPYDLDLIKGERIRIDNYLKERGFYFFSPEYLIARVDSTNADNTVNMRLVTKQETPREAREVYRINDVYIYSGYNLGTANIDTSKRYAELHEGYYIIDRRKRFKPKMFTNIMQFNPGEVYNRTDHNLTLSRLINLDEFKFVKNRFEPVSDSNELDAFYYLTPHPKKSLRAAINATTKSNNMNGTEITVNWRNRNTFRAGEHLSISAYIGSEVQFGGPWKGFNTHRTGAEANFTIPRFVIPFFDVRTRGSFVPRTNIQLGYDILNRTQLYTLNSFRGGLGYLWKESIEKQHEFYPVAISYVQPLNITQRFRDSIAKFPYLTRIIDSQFVLGTTYQFNYNQVASGVRRINSFYFNGLADLSGNVAGLVMGGSTEPGKEARIFNAVFNQYIKLEVDGRYYRRFGLNSTWANRIIIGYGHPYGNSKQLPYIKQFFVGGNNSIRAFRSRTLGPGTFPLLSASGFFPDQTGDIKLEMNTEYRPHISGPLHGAVFIDAGNIWLANEDPNRPGAKFSKNFLNELAIGGGVGIRFDIVLFVIRFDVAVPIKKPWEENPWYLQQLNLRNVEGRRENIMYNLAIGYPF